MAASESLRALSAADAPEAEEARLCGECRGPMVPVRHEQRAGRIAARLRIADVRSSGTQAREHAPRRASIGKERQSQAPVQPCHVRAVAQRHTGQSPELFRLKRPNSMTPATLMPDVAPLVFSKDTLVNGKPATIRCLEIAGQTFSINSG